MAIESISMLNAKLLKRQNNPKLFNIAVDYKISLNLHFMPFL